MARGRPPSFTIVLSPEERKELERWTRCTTIPAGRARRARIVLLLARGKTHTRTAELAGVQRRVVYTWGKRFVQKRIDGLDDKPGRGAKPRFPPQLAAHVVKVACERPDDRGRSLSQWDCAELGRQMVRDGIVDTVSSSTIGRILKHHKLKPWRKHYWLTRKKPRDEAFRRAVEEIIDLYVRPLRPDEIVLSLDEKTSLQPPPTCDGHQGGPPRR